MHTVDRVSVGALGLALAGSGVFLAGTPGATEIHALVAIIAIILAMPAAVCAIQGRLLPYSDEGVLISGGCLVFVTLEVAFSSPTDNIQTVGMVILLAAATAATFGLYFRLFGVLRAPRIGRHRVGEDVD